MPTGDDRERLICRDCGFVYYTNPKIVVGAVAAFDDRILLCRRAIPPRAGYWTLPAGYLEERETPEQGAVREAYEEAGAQLEIDTLLAVYTISRLSQVQLIYRANLSTAQLEAGPESAAVALFSYDDIPWSSIAFPSVVWALEHARQVWGRRQFAPFRNPDGEVGDLDAFSRAQQQGESRLTNSDTGDS